MNNNDASLFGIVIVLIIVGGSVLMIAVLSNQQPNSAIYGCGSDTFYHKETNSCELFPPLNKNQIKLSKSLVTLLEDTNNKMMDDDIEYDDRGYAKTNCPVMSGVNWDMDSKCIITLKNPMN